MKITYEMVKAGARHYVEGGCSGLTDYEREEVVESILYAALEAGDKKFQMGDIVRKKSGSWWEGRVVGFYSTEQTPDGYDVQLVVPGIAHPSMPVQIYPGSALEYIG